MDIKNLCSFFFVCTFACLFVCLLWCFEITKASSILTLKMKSLSMLTSSEQWDNSASHYRSNHLHWIEWRMQSSLPSKPKRSSVFLSWGSAIKAWGFFNVSRRYDLTSRDWLPKWNRLSCDSFYLLGFFFFVDRTVASEIPIPLNKDTLCYVELQSKRFRI